MNTLETIFLEQNTAKFIESLSGSTPIYKLPVAEARKVLDDLQKTAKVEKKPAQIEDLMIPSTKGQISIRIIRPQNAKEKLPAIMHFHGGGWILGNKDTHDRLSRDIAVGVHAAVVFVNYSPSPEKKYPTAIEEAFAATKYIAEEGSKHNIDTKRIALFGDSVGGNMAIATTLLAKERNGPKITYQVLFYPVTDASLNTPSYHQFQDGPWLTKPAMEWFWNAYEPNAARLKNPTLTPINASIENLRHLPPALIITAENDVLRDEGEAFAHKLMQAGVDVTAVRFLGTIHDFVLLNSIRNTPATQHAIDFAIANLQKAFKI